MRTTYCKTFAHFNSIFVATRDNLIGNMYELLIEVNYDVVSKWLQWRKKYGPVYTVWHGETPVVVLANSELYQAHIKKNASAYTGRDFFNKLFSTIQCKQIDLSRSKTRNLKILAIHGHHGILRTDGEHWKSVRTDTIALIHQIGLLEKCKLEDWASF